MKCTLNLCYFWRRNDNFSMFQWGNLIHLTHIKIPNGLHDYRSTIFPICKWDKVILSIPVCSYLHVIGVKGRGDILIADLSLFGYTCMFRLFWVSLFTIPWFVVPAWMKYFKWSSGSTTTPYVSILESSWPFKSFSFDGVRQAGDVILFERKKTSIIKSRSTACAWLLDAQTNTLDTLDNDSAL